MIIADILFKICFAPFRESTNGRTAAIIWLVQIVGFSGMAVVNIDLFKCGIYLSSVGIAIFGAVIGSGVYFLFDKIYIKNNRAVGYIRFRFLMGLLVFALLIGSIFLLIFSLARF